MGPPFDSVQLVNITSLTIVYDTYNKLVVGVYTSAYDWGPLHGGFHKWGCSKLAGRFISWKILLQMDNNKYPHFWAPPYQYE